jgi:hypothetical protein
MDSNNETLLVMAADQLNCSVRWVEQKLASGELPSLTLEDVKKFKAEIDAKRNEVLNELATISQELGLYD